MTSRERRRYWRSENRRKAAYRQAGRKMFDVAFDSQIRPLMDVIDGADDILNIQLPPLDNSAIADAYDRLYVNCGLSFAQDRRKRLESAKADDEIFDSLVIEQMRRYLERNAGATITAVGDTSKIILADLIKKITREMLDDEMTPSSAITAFRDRIASEWHRAKRYRIERIVRTEVNRASNYGALRGADYTAQMAGVQLEKGWISAFVGESREAHKAADGQIVAFDEPFIVDGQELHYPGDPTRSSAGNTINCLCSMFERVRR